MRVLVTGAFGFVGRAVARRLLDAGHEVVALHSPWSSGQLPPDDGLTVAKADVRDSDALAPLVAEVNGIVHLAARTRVRDSFADPVGYFDSNIGGTVALLRALEMKPAIPFLLASTTAVYGIADHYPVNESTLPKPANPYTASKVGAEALVRYAADADLVSALVLRFANAAGAVDSHGDQDTTRIIPKALAVAAGRYPHVHVNGDGSARREFVHVLDLADACVQALQLAARERQVGEVLNVGSGMAVSVAEVLAAAEAATGRRIEVHRNPPAQEPPVVFADNRRALALLGWKPVRSDLEQLMADAWRAELRHADPASL